MNIFSKLVTNKTKKSQDMQGLFVNKKRKSVSSSNKAPEDASVERD